MCNYDHFVFYETCACIRSIDEHRVPKHYCLEHTYPIFNEKKSFVSLLRGTTENDKISTSNISTIVVLTN